MHANSRIVSSNQSTIHEQLSALVTRHTNSHFKKPIAEVNRLGFERSITAWRDAGSQALIIDAGCGVGLSTQRLARAHPASFVIGIDQSADRIGRHPTCSNEQAANYTLVRANLVDYWRLLLEARVRPQQHYLLYPNPWQKNRNYPGAGMAIRSSRPSLRWAAQSNAAATGKFILMNLPLPCSS